jgi:arylsulfatase A-like enzyme
VPLIVSHPGTLPRGKVTSALTEYIGLCPTLAELCGLEPPCRTTLVAMPGAPEKMDAVSFADILRDPGREGPPVAFSESQLRSPLCMYMARSRRYKYIFNDGATHELYDLEADPGEFVNRINDPALDAVRRDLHDRLFAWYDPRTNRYRPSAAPDRSAKK